MFSKLVSLLVFIGVFLLAVNCDPTVSPVDKLNDSPAIINVTISPSVTNFTSLEGKKDTIVINTVVSEFQNLTTESKAGYYIVDKSTGLVTDQGDFFYDSSTENFVFDLVTETRTTFFKEFLVQVYAYDTNGNGNYYQATTYINGFSLFSPEITNTSSPSIIIRPETGETIASFNATVTDQDDDETIENVFLRIIDQSSGEVTGSPFIMSDNGTSLGDETANDLVYTWSLPVPANPSSGIIERDYDIQFFAIDKSGLVSDTVRTTFSIRGN